MNLAFFLTPVSDVVWLSQSARVGEAIDSLRNHRYTAVPLLDADGCYVGTVTATDLLFFIRGEDRPSATLADVPRRVENRAVGIDTDIRGLLAIAADQNFVPVVDSRGVLMGIVTRKAILTFFEHLLGEHGLLSPSAQ